MSEIILNEATDTTPVGATLEGQPIGTWLDGQREVAIQKGLDALEGNKNSNGRGDHLSGLLCLQLGAFSAEEVAQAQTLKTALVEQMDQRLMAETNPKVKAFLDLWVTRNSEEIDSLLARKVQLTTLTEISLLKEALSQTTDLRSRHVIYQELFQRQIRSGAVTVQSIRQTFDVMVENANKLRTQELSLFIQAVLEEKEPPKMTQPLLEIYQLVGKMGKSLPVDPLLEREGAFVEELIGMEKTCLGPFLGLKDLAQGDKLREKLVEAGKGLKATLPPYQGEFDRRYYAGLLVLLTLHHTGGISEEQNIRMAPKFYSHQARSTADHVMILRGLADAALFLAKEKPEEGEKLLQRIKTSFIDQYIYLRWVFNTEEDILLRAYALLELGQVAHRCGYPSKHSFAEEADTLVRRNGFRSEADDLRKQFGYKYTTKTWFNL
ncbi:MAG: hypothetical protein H7A38_00590 [Chlamydiales bacterium]|nr:hypothetical protein [Chlamydiales bacterium]